MRRFLWLSLGALLLAGVAVASSGGATQAEGRWVITDLGTLGGKQTEALDINNRGQIVGRRETKLRNGIGDPIWHAVLWQQGEMIDLVGDLPPRVDSKAWAINERGQIVIRTDEADYLWYRGKLTKFGVPPSFRVSLYSDHEILNERGQIAGVTDALSLSGNWNAAIWKKGRVTTVLGTLARQYDCGYDAPPASGPGAINERGEVIGWSATDVRDDGGRCIEHAFLWRNGTMHDLGTLADQPSSKYPNHSGAVDFNERGQVVGWSDVKLPPSDTGLWYWESVDHAVLWQDGKIIDLHSLALADPLGESHAGAINQRGAIVGWIATPRFEEMSATVWQGGRAINLRPPGRQSQAVAINDRGQIVGETHLEGAGVSRVFVWADGMATLLPTLPGGRQTSALEVNERQQVIGTSEVARRCERAPCRHAVLWTLKRG